MSRFPAINLAALPALPIPARDYDTIYAARIAELTARLAAKKITFNTGTIDGDPLSAVEQAGAYRELVTLNARDDAIRALLLATSWGSYLDALGATEDPPVQRLALVTNPRPFATFSQDWESDDDFRARIQLAPEALSTCGPEGGYQFFAESVSGVLNVAVYGPISYGGTKTAPFTPLGQVDIVVVSSPYVDPATGNQVVDGTASASLCAAVAANVTADDKRPIADFVNVVPAIIVPYMIDATLYVGPGADAGTVQSTALARLQAQAARQHRPGAAQLLQMLYGGAYVTDSTGAIVVDQVTLNQPTADINATPITAASPSCAYAAPFCTSINVTVVVVND